MYVGPDSLAMHGRLILAIDIPKARLRRHLVGSDIVEPPVSFEDRFEISAGDNAGAAPREHFGKGIGDGIAHQAPTQRYRWALNSRELRMATCQKRDPGLFSLIRELCAVANSENVGLVEGKGDARLKLEHVFAGERNSGFALKHVSCLVDRETLCPGAEQARLAVTKAHGRRRLGLSYSGGQPLDHVWIRHQRRARRHLVAARNQRGL